MTKVYELEQYACYKMHFCLFRRFVFSHYMVWIRSGGLTWQEMRSTMPVTQGTAPPRPLQGGVSLA